MKSTTRNAVVVTLGLILIAVIASWAADPAWKMVHHDLGDFYVDSSFGGNWEPGDSIVFVGDDSAYMVYTLEGFAYMYSDDILYYGAGNDSGNFVDSATSATTGQTHTNFDTLSHGPTRHKVPAFVKVFFK